MDVSLDTSVKASVRSSEPEVGSSGPIAAARVLWKEGVSVLFGRLSRGVFRSPLQILLMSISMATICSVGLGWMKPNSKLARLTHLYDVHNNPAHISQARIENAFREKVPQEAHVYIAPGSKSSKNLLERSNLLAMLSLYEQININVTASPNGENYQHKKVCYRPGGVRGECDAISIVNYWSSAPRYNIEKDQNITETITRRSGQSTWEDALGRHLEPGSVMGEVKRDASDKIVSVKASHMRFRIRTSARDKDRDPLADSWQASLRRYVKQFGSHKLRLEVLTDLEQEIYIPITSKFDIILAAIGILGSSVYATGALSNGHVSNIAMSAWLVFANVAVVALASVCTVSISVLFGIYYAPATLVVILFLFGVAMNCMFFLVSAVVHSSPVSVTGSADLEQMGENAMVGGASFVGPASLASFLAMCGVLATGGGISDIRFVHSVLLQALLGLGFLFLFEWTFFVACLAVDLRGGYRFISPLCCGSPRDGAQASGRVPPVQALPDSLVTKLLNSWLPEMLLHPAGTFGALIVTVVLAVLGVLATIRTRTGFNPDELILSNQHLHSQMNIRNAYFPEGSSPVPFEVVIKYSYPNPWSGVNNRRVQNSTKSLSDELKRMKCVASVDSWYDSFMNWAPDVNKASVPIFFERLDNFLTEKGSRYRKDILFFTSRETLPFIQVSRITGTFKQLHNPKDKVAAMRSLRALESRNTEGEIMIVWSPAFAKWEGLSAVRKDTPIMLGCATAAGFLALVLVLASFSGSSAILLATVTVTVEVVGFVYIIGRSLNPTTIITLFLAIALFLHSCTFTVVITLITRTHFQLDRLQASWFHAGGAVLHSSLAFLLAIVPMVVAKSLLLRTLFQMLAITTALGLWHNLIATPLILSVFSFQTFLLRNPEDGGQRPPSENKGPNSVIGEDGLLRTISLKFRPLPRIAPFVTIPEDAVLEGNTSVFTLE